MLKIQSIILVLVIGFIGHGCATHQVIDSSSEREIQKQQMSKSEMSDALKKLEMENDRLQKQLVEAEKMTRQIQDENQKKLAHVSERNRLLNQEVEKLKNENQRIIKENEAVERKDSSMPMKTEPDRPKNSKVDKNISKLKIKVLFGDGELDSARAMARRLRQMGYPVQLVDQAPRSDFDLTTIYYAPKLKYEAKRLEAHLNERLMLKPLSWPSSFDLIVVTGSKK